MKDRIRKKSIAIFLLLSILYQFRKGGLTDMAASAGGSSMGGMTGKPEEEEEPKEDEYPQKLSVLQSKLDYDKTIKAIYGTISEIKDRMHVIETQINGRLHEIEDTGSFSLSCSSTSLMCL